MPAKRTNTGIAERSSARNSPRPVSIRSYTAGRHHGLTSSSASGCLRLRDGRLGHVLVEGADASDALAVFVGSELGDLDPIPEGLERRAPENHLARLRQLLHGGELVDEPAGEDVDELDLRVADHEAACGSDHDRDLHPQLNARPAGRDDLPDARDGLLHREGTRDGTRAVVAVQPARDRVAAEVDDVAAVAVELSR